MNQIDEETHLKIVEIIHMQTDYHLHDIDASES